MKNASGKLVIIAILTMAVAAAGASWWFRYNATHDAAKFWGPEAARIIRDAPHVYFKEGEVRQFADFVEYQYLAGGYVTDAKGITHLRNALLEDRSFDWPAPTNPPELNSIDWIYVLEFRRTDDGAMHAVEDVEFKVLFSPDFKWVAGWGPNDRTDRITSCRPIADGLRQMFEEFKAITNSPAARPQPPR